MNSIVIGSGFGGIAAAIRLKAKGHKVKLIEKHSDLGGRARVFKKDGFTFDAGPTVITAPYLINELFNLFNKNPEDYIKLTPLKIWYQFVFEDQTKFNYSGDEVEMKKQIKNLNQDDLQPITDSLNGNFIQIGNFSTDTISVISGSNLVSVAGTPSIKLTRNTPVNRDSIWWDNDLVVNLQGEFELQVRIPKNPSAPINDITWNPFNGTLPLISSSTDLGDFALLNATYPLTNSVTLPNSKIFSAFISIIFAIGLVIYMKKSKLGRAIRATAQNARAAKILGVDTEKVYAATFGINAALCGVAGALISITFTIHPYMGLPYTIRSFMIVIVAGLGNLPGVAMSGMGLGVFEEFADYILGTEFRIGSVFLLLVLILVYRRFKLSRKREYLK